MNAKEWSPRWKKRTPEDVKTAVEKWLKERELFRDTRVYTREEWRERGEPYGNGAVATIATEGPLYAIMNYGEAPRTLELLIGFLEKMGLWYELGYAWSIHLYPHEPGRIFRVPGS
jgi:hypothetical protein